MDGGNPAPLRVRHAHVKQRAAERYGLVLTDADVAEICRQVRDKETVVLRSMVGHENGKKIASHLVKIQNTVIAVLMQMEECFIVTVLPKEALTNRERVDYYATRPGKKGNKHKARYRKGNR